MGGPTAMVNMAVEIPPSSYHPGGVNTLIGDGSVRFVKDSTALNVWQALSTRNGGEVIERFGSSNGRSIDTSPFLRPGVSRRRFVCARICRRPHAGDLTGPPTSWHARLCLWITVRRSLRRSTRAHEWPCRTSCSRPMLVSGIGARARPRTAGSGDFALRFAPVSGWDSRGGGRRPGGDRQRGRQPARPGTMGEYYRGHSAYCQLHVKAAESLVSVKSRHVPLFSIGAGAGGRAGRWVPGDATIQRPAHAQKPQDQ